MTEHLRAYNSLWQVRSDSWCRLEEAADRLTRPTTTGAHKDKWASACLELEVGHDESLGRQHPGDALTTPAPPGGSAVAQVGADELTGE